MTILDKIISEKRKEIEILKKRRPLALLKKKMGPAPARHFFLRALRNNSQPAVIAEIKRRSPSKGLLRNDFRPVKLARDFEAAGASALSVLTDRKFFGGSSQFLKKVRAVTTLPILRKDFILDEYQVYETREMGAHALLLIAATLSHEELEKLSALANRLGLDILFEVHTEAELKKVLRLKPLLIGINNRNLDTFHVSLKTTQRLSKKISRKTMIVSESGIQNAADLVLLQKWGVGAVLVGESLMREKDAKRALQRLLGDPHDSR